MIQYFLPLLAMGCGIGINLDKDEDNDGYNFGPGKNDDCNDLDPSIHPGAKEIPFDGIDQNCSNRNNIDDEDADGDGQTFKDGDCDDKAAFIFKGAVEFKDGVDNDCDGSIDEDNSLDSFVLWNGQNDYPSTVLSFLGTDLDSDGYSEIIVGDSEGNGEEQRSGLAHLLYSNEDQNPVYQSIWGSSANDRFGSALASGDFDGNGEVELIVGATANQDGGTASGSVALFLANSSLSDTSYNQADVILYGSEFSYAGSSLASADVDGNGANELIVGAYGLSTAYLLNQDSLKDGALADEAAQTLTSGLIGDQFGFSLAAQDVNGDGMADILIGAPQHSDEDHLATGAIYLFLGTQNQYPTDFDSVWLGENDFDNAGYSLATGGDVDGDGYNDILIGAPGKDTYAEDSGEVLSIKGTAQIDEIDSLASSYVSISGSTDFAQVGLAASFAGDIDDDGQSDILLTGLKHNDANPVAAAYAFLGDGLESEMITSQASAVFLSNDTNLNIVPGSVGNFDGQFYDTMGPYDDYGFALSDRALNQTLIFSIPGQETKP